jgi:hypothetical protein
MIVEPRGPCGKKLKPKENLKMPRIPSGGTFRTVLQGKNERMAGAGISWRRDWAKYRGDPTLEVWRDVMGLNQMFRRIQWYMRLSDEDDVSL